MNFKCFFTGHIMWQTGSKFADVGLTCGSLREYFCERCNKKWEVWTQEAVIRTVRPIKEITLTTWPFSRETSPVRMPNIKRLIEGNYIGENPSRKYG